MHNFPAVQPSTDERTVDLKDLMRPLHFTKTNHIRERFSTFCRKANLSENLKSYKSDTYIDPVNGKIVPTFLMTPAIAAAFCTYVNPAYGVELVTSLLHQPVDAIHHDLLFKISIPERWVVEVIKRSCSSVRRSLTLAIDRCKGTELEKHWCYRDGERWYTPWFLANAPFAKEDGMAFKGVLTALSETLQIEQVPQKYLEADA